MKIDILNVLTRVEKEKEFHDKVSYNQEVLESVGILDLKETHVTGKIYLNSEDRLEIECSIDGIMVLPCSITLEPVDYPFHIEIEDDLLDLLEEITENSKKSENSIDISPIIWENILMEIPMKVTSEKAKNISLEGNGWKFVTDEEEK